MSGPFDIFGLGADPDNPQESPARKAQLASKRPLPKKFYEAVDIVENDGAFQLQLDGRPVRTPARRVVEMPSRAVADILADEWRTQKDVIDPKSMPLTRLINSALDSVAENAAAVRDEIVRFSGTDLLCYRVDNPERLVERQNTAWDPVIRWAEERYGCHFRLVAGIMHVDQPEATTAAIADAVSRIDDSLSLAGLHSMTTLMGSCLLALAVFENRLTAEDAWGAAHIDEDWNIELWGEDEEASQRRAYRWQDMKAAAALASLAH